MRYIKGKYDPTGFEEDMKKNQGGGQRRKVYSNARRNDLVMCSICNAFHIKGKLYREAYKKLHNDKADGLKNA